MYMEYMHEILFSDSNPKWLLAKKIDENGVSFLCVEREAIK